MYQSHIHPVTVMTSFPSSAASAHPDIKSPPSSSSPYCFSTLSTNNAAFSMAQHVGWNDTTGFGSFTSSPEETYSPLPPPPIMTSSAYQSPSPSNVSFEEDELPLFFSPTTTVATHSPTELSPTSSSAASFYPIDPPSHFLTSPPPITYYHSPPTAKPMHHYNTYHQDYQHHPLCYPKQHQKSVPLARPYSCPTCPRAFARKHDLQRHIRVHTGAKPYLCVACKKPFARTDALKRHLRIEDACRLSPEIQALKGAGKRRYRNL